MNIIRTLLGSLLILVITTGFICDKEDGPTGTGEPGLTASSTNMTMLPGQERQITVTSGTAPYSLVQNSNPSAVQASFVDGYLSITTLTVGTALITVQDASSPAKQVSITVNVVSTITLPTAGTLSFTMPSGAFTASGKFSAGSDLPTGEGAGALMQYNGIALVAYKSYSATRMDLFEADYLFNTSLKTGMYYYPGSGNRVQVLYIKNVNPMDTTVKPTIYYFSGATSEVTSATLSSFAGTFSGTATNISNTSDQMAVTGGTFNVPMMDVGGNTDRAVTGDMHAMIERLKARYLRKE